MTDSILVDATLEGEALLEKYLRHDMPGRIALVSSFGTEAAVLLDMVARIDRNAPVIFIDTGKLFPETLAYRDRLIAHLGLTNVQTIGPETSDIARSDSAGDLWKSNTDACCHLRKVVPLEKALEKYDGWITGRKRSHGGLRADLALTENENGKIKINPLARWSASDIARAFLERGLPQHPLQGQGYTSVGCMPCTAKPADPSDPRSGRWADSDKTECGIHFIDGKMVRGKPQI